MIVVDTNYFLRLVTRPVTPQDEVTHRDAETLFRRAEVGLEVFTTTDAIIAEVVFVLQRHCGLGRIDAAKKVRPLLQLKGCRLPTRTWCVYALDLWEISPKLSFVDALAAVQARETGDVLATFDQDLAKASEATIWQAPGSNESA